MKKVIDKATDSGYNTHTEYRQVDYTTYTSNRITSDRVDLDLTDLAAALQTVSKTHDVKPVVAGGCIRDLLFGYAPKDWDIFVDVSKHEDPDEFQDFVDSFLYDFCMAMRGADFGERMGWPYSIEPMTGKDVLPQYKDMEGTFLVKEWGASEQIWAPYQFIFMKEPMIEENPSAWIDKRFDYNLVKCYMNPMTKEVYASEAFLKDITAKHIVVPNQAGFNRVLRWTSRTGHRVIPILEKARNENNKTKPSAVPKVFVERCLQHPKKWVG